MKVICKDDQERQFKMKNAVAMIKAGFTRARVKANGELAFTKPRRGEVESFEARELIFRVQNDCHA